MTIEATLVPPDVTAVPGGEASVELRVRNAGNVVDELRFTVVGGAEGWTAVHPDTVSLFPGSEATVTVRFSPPRHADSTAGRVPYGVRIASRADPEAERTEEGTVEVVRFVDLTVELSPRVVRASRRAAVEVAVANRGNAEAVLDLAVVDPDEVLSYELDPATTAIPPGGVAFAKLRLRPRKRFRRGPAATRRFQVSAVEDGATLASGDAMFVQEATEPPWLRRALLWSLLGAVALVALWFAVLRPTIASTAREAVAADDPPVTIGPGGDGGGGRGGGSAGGGGGDDSSGADGAGGAGAEAEDGSVALFSGTPIDGRLSLDASGTTAFEVPAGRTLQLTDIVLQNPNASTGTLEIRRDGAPLLVVELANFRDLDYHFVAPIVFRSGESLELNAACTSPGCRTGAYFVGFLSP